MTKFKILPALLCMAAIPQQALSIDLDCDAMAQKVAAELAEQGLLVEGNESRAHANKIVISSCQTAQVSADQQLEKTKQDWLKNWLLEDTGGKPGNERLKKLKR